MFIAASSITTFQNDAVDIVNGVSVRPVTGIATSFGPLVQLGTDALLYSGFAWRGTANIVRARLQVDRLARVQDRIIQLSDGVKLIGSNQANPLAEDLNVYEFTGSFAVNASFGIVIDLGAHQLYPSSTMVYIRSLTLEFA